MSRTRWAIALGLCLGALLCAAPGAVALPAGGLSPLAAQPCIQLAPVKDCGANAAVGLEGPRGVTISPDGKFVYVLANDGANGDGVAEFARNPATGTLKQLAAQPCIQDPSRTACADRAPGLVLVQQAVVSPDGTDLYAFADQDVAELARNPTTGVLTPIQGHPCIGSSTGPCTDKTSGIDGLSGGAITPDGRRLYAASFFGHAVVELDRNKFTGILVPIPGNPCIQDTASSSTCPQSSPGLHYASSVTVAPNGRFVYVSADGPGATATAGAVSEFTADGTGALTPISGHACVMATGGAAGCPDSAPGLMGGSRGIAISPDGHNVYATSDMGAIAELSINQTTGALNPIAGHACIQGPGAPDGCPDSTPVMSAPFAVAVSRDGLSVYAATNAGQLVEFNRNPKTGVLRPIPGNNCIDAGGGCPRHGPAMSDFWGLAVSPDGRQVYVPSEFSSALLEYARMPYTPALTSASISPKRLLPIPRHPKPGKHYGGLVRWTLNIPATVTLTVRRLAHGRRVHKKCVAPSKRNRHAPRCTRVLRLGSLPTIASASAGSFRFNGHLHGHVLPAGSYQLVLTPSASRVTGRSVVLSFRIKAA